MANGYYVRGNGKLDKGYLRLCACYKLLRKQIIGKARALELIAERHTENEMKTLRSTVELWEAYPLKGTMLP